MTKISLPCAKTSSKISPPWNGGSSLLVVGQTLTQCPAARIDQRGQGRNKCVRGEARCEAATSAKVDRVEFLQHWRQMEAMLRAPEDNDRDELAGFAVLSLGANFQQSRDSCANCACNESQRRRTRTCVVVGFTSKWDTKLFLGCFRWWITWAPRPRRRTSRAPHRADINGVPTA